MTGIIALAALQGRSLAQLQTLHQQVQQELVRSDAGSYARRDALASLEIISLAIGRARIAGPRC